MTFEPPRAVLLLSDSPDRADAVRRALTDLADVQVAGDARLGLAQARSTHPDLLLLTADASGLDTRRRLQEDARTATLPVIFLTAGEEQAQQAWEAEPSDCVDTEPLRESDLRARVKRLLNRSEGAAHQRLEEATVSFVQALREMAFLNEARNDKSGRHLERLSRYCDLLAGELARSGTYPKQVTPEFLRWLASASSLHDIGQAPTPDSILSKSGTLTSQEFADLKDHTLRGAASLERASEGRPTEPFLEIALQIVRSHHERWDGSGYPQGLKGEEIPLAARVVALADVYDALTTTRPYKPAWSPERAREALLAGRGSQFDPAVVDAFLACERAFADCVDASATASAPLPRSLSGRGRPRVLVVDDAPENIHVLLHALNGLCDVLAATNGERGLTLARQVRPDLILLDVVMNELSGYDVAAQLRADPDTAAIPVIFVTSLDESGDEQRGLALGAVDYISKPFHPELVRARVMNQLELKSHRDHLEEEVVRRTEALLAASAREQRLDSELRVASELQLSLLPPGLCRDARLGSWELAASLQPARAVGGDLYDYFFTEDGTLLFACGDVSDKGAAAALFMVRVHALLRTLGASSRSPADLLKSLNAALSADNPAGMFVTLMCGMVRLDGDEVRLASAGHEPPVRVPRDGPARLEQWEGSGAAGLWPDASFQDHVCRLQPGEALVLYTDGVPEALNAEGQAFGEERLLHELSALAGGTAERLVAVLTGAVDTFQQGLERYDDVATLVLKRGSLNRVLVTDPDQLDELQGQLAGALGGWGYSTEMTHDLQLITEEVVLNVLEHSGAPELGCQVEWRQEGQVVILLFCDRGTPFDPLAAEAKVNDDEPGGWGIPLLQAMADRVEYQRDGDCNLLRVERGERDFSAEPAKPTAH